MFYQGNRNQFKQHLKVSKDIAILIISIVNNGEFLEIIKEQEGDKVDMCILLDTIRQEGLQEGRNTGRLEERISILIDLLKDKFNPLSEDTVTEIEKSNLKQLDSLKSHFFKLNQQEDIIKVLNNTKNL